MVTVKTALGKEYACDYFNPCQQVGQINLRVVGATLVEVASVFSDPAETQQMWWEREYAAQYTRLIAIVPEGDAIRVVLGKE